jgi:hypothetical protein
MLQAEEVSFCLFKSQGSELYLVTKLAVLLLQTDGLAWRARA